MLKWAIFQYYIFLQKLLQKEIKSDKLSKVKILHNCCKMKIVILKYLSLNLKPISGKIPTKTKNKIEKRYESNNCALLY